MEGKFVNKLIHIQQLLPERLHNKTQTKLITNI